MPLSAHKMRRDTTLIETFTKSMSEMEITAGFSPTVGGALAWLKRHKDELNTALRLVQMYPLLIQEDCLDGLWVFVQPMLHGYARKEQLLQGQGYGYHSGSYDKTTVGSWDSSDLPLSSSTPQTRGHLLAPVIKPSMSVHGLDTAGLKIPESNQRATSASATVPIIVPRAPSIGRSHQHSEDRHSFDCSDNAEQDMRKRALSCGSPRRNLVRRTDSSSSKGSSTGKPTHGSGHTSPDDASTEMTTQAPSNRGLGESVVLPPIPNIEGMQTRLTNRRQSLRRQTSIGYITTPNSTVSDTTTTSTQGGNSNYTSGYDSRVMTPSMSETAYLVFRKSLNGTVHTPELVHWPLKMPEARRDSWMSNFWEDDSDASLILDSNVNFDIDLRSESVTPDLL